ncbi:MAG: sensor histidine kinase, partial [Bacteroidota bacterium]
KTNQEILATLKTEYEVAEKDQEIALLAKDAELQELRVQRQQSNFRWLLFGLGGVLLVAGLLFYQTRKLNAANGALASSQNKLQKSLTEKETLLKEIHHRVKNNLQLVTSLLNLQATEAPEQTLEEFLYQGQNRVKSMALIHEQLYQSEELTDINMASYTSKLVAAIGHAFGMTDHIDFRVNVAPVRLDIDQAIPLGLILNELITNSLKYAFEDQEGGALSVDLKNEGEQIELLVSDNGKGMDPNLQVEGSGLRLVNLLAKQLKGSYQLLLGEGTVVKIAFPHAKQELVYA